MSRRVAVAARRYANGGTVKNPPPSLQVWSMLKVQPAALGGVSILDQPGQLWAEFEQYATQERLAAASAAERARAASRRRARGNG